MAYEFIHRSACPACASSQSTVLADVPFDGKEVGPLLTEAYGINPAILEGSHYKVIECGECGTLYQCEIGGELLLDTLYDQWLHADLNPDYQATYDWLVANAQQSRDGHDVMMVASILKTPLDRFRTLDFGMGQALWARIAHALGCVSHGFDLSHARMSFAAEHGVRTVALDAIAGGNFDYINTEQVMEHVADVASVMETLSQGLRPGGILKISVPAQGSVRATLAQVAGGATPSLLDIDPTFPLEHVNAFSKRGLVELGGRFGLSPFEPGLAARTTFLKQPRNWLSTNWRNMAKELVRPFTRYENVKNLTIWLKAEG